MDYAQLLAQGKQHGFANAGGAAIAQALQANGPEQRVGRLWSFLGQTPEGITLALDLRRQGSDVAWFEVIVGPLHDDAAQLAQQLLQVRLKLRGSEGSRRATTTAFDQRLDLCTKRSQRFLQGRLNGVAGRWR